MCHSGGQQQLVKLVSRVECVVQLLWTYYKINLPLVANLFSHCMLFEYLLNNGYYLQLATTDSCSVAVYSYCVYLLNGYCLYL